MKPQIVNLEPGKHNEDVPKSSDRIVRGGSWKKQRTIIVLPAADSIPTKCALALWTLTTPPNQPCHRIAALGMEVGEAYSSTINEIINHPDLTQWEFLLTVEHDNIPPGDGLVKLITDMEEHPEYACIGGLYWTKGPEGVPQIWGDPRDPQLNFRPQFPVPNSLQECCGTGMGFNLWRLSMFKDTRLRKPWFKTLNGSEGQGVGTQDLYFWSDARKYGYRCAIDTRILVGHYDLQGQFGPPDTVW